MKIKYLFISTLVALSLTSCFARRPSTLRLPGVWAASREGVRTWMIGVAEAQNPSGIRNVDAPEPQEIERRNGVRRYASLGDNILIVELAFPDRHGRSRCMLVYSPEKDNVDVVWTPFKIEREISRFGKKVLFADLP